MDAISLNEFCGTLGISLWAVSVSNFDPKVKPNPAQHVGSASPVRWQLQHAVRRLLESPAPVKISWPVVHRGASGGDHTSAVIEDLPTPTRVLSTGQWLRSRIANRLIPDRLAVESSTRIKPSGRTRQSGSRPFRAQLKVLLGDQVRRPGRSPVVCVNHCGNVHEFRSRPPAGPDRVLFLLR